jgi:hypothetical protein
MKWAVLPGLILALLANLFQLLGRWAFVDPVSVYNTERPLRWIERLIWPQQWIFYTPYNGIRQGCRSATDCSKRPTRLACIGLFFGAGGYWCHSLWVRVSGKLFA